MNMNKVVIFFKPEACMAWSDSGHLYICAFFVNKHKKQAAQTIFISIL